MSRKNTRKVNKVSVEDLRYQVNLRIDRKDKHIKMFATKNGKIYIDWIYPATTNSVEVLFRKNEWPTEDEPIEIL